MLIDDGLLVARRRAVGARRTTSRDVSGAADDLGAAVGPPRPAVGARSGRSSRRAAVVRQGVPSRRPRRALARRPRRPGRAPAQPRPLVARSSSRRAARCSPGEDAYRFRHLLIRDAAYDAIPKRERADLHEAFARWLERVAGERVAEQEEILGYHLEQAYRLRVEIGAKDDRGPALARAAADHLAAAGRRSYARGDTVGAIALFARAVDLLPVTDPDRVRYGIELGISLAWGGREVRALEVLADADAAAAAIGDLGLQMHAVARPDRDRIVARGKRLGAMEAGGRTRDRGLRAGRRRSRTRARVVPAGMGSQRAVVTTRRRIAPLLRALDHAEAAGDRRLRAELLGMWCASIWGPVSVTEGLARCEEVLARGGGSREFEADVARTQAAFEAMRGDFAQARARYSDGKAILDELARPVVSAFAVQEGWYIEMIARDFRRAEELTRTEYGRHVEADSLPLQDITRDMLALALCAQERFEEADALGRVTERKVFGSRGRHRAERLASGPCQGALGSRRAR